MNALFIADLHLSEERPQTTAAFLAFLAGPAARCETLYLLGDVFDAWIGDDDDRPLAADVAHALQALAHRGVRILFQHGNRDFLLGNSYAARCGMTLLPEYHRLEWHGKPVLLAHGDQLCTGDSAYQQFRALVRNPDWQADFLAKPLTERKAIAADLRNRSREANSLKAADIMDVAPSEVEACLVQHEATLLIHGHTHRPARHTLHLPDGSAAERLVLGEWDTGFWYITGNADGFQLHQQACLS